MASSNGNTDSYFINEVRRILRDQSVWYGESQPTDATTGSATGGSKPFRLQRAPVTVGSVQGLTAPGGPWTVNYNLSTLPTGTNVNIVTDTGEVIFPSAPAVGTLALSYQATRFSDTQILDSLTDGLNLLWPEIWNPTTDTTTILVSPTQYEYLLPPVFQDKYVTLLSVEFAPPSGVVRYYRTAMWRVLQDTVGPKLVFARIPPVASTVRLSYARPLAALGETSSTAQNLPVYYAVSRLLMDQEVMRGRSDDLAALTGETANPTGSASNTSSYWYNMFKEELTKLSLTEPARLSVMGRAVEQLGLSEFWTRSA
jgi:hypothetical protein